MSNNAESSTKGTSYRLSAIAVTLSIAAIILSLAALGKSGNTPSGGFSGQLTGMMEEKEVIQTAKIKSYAELSYLDWSSEGKEMWISAADKLAETRVVLEAAYREAGRESTKEWIDLNNEFNQLENNLRSGVEGSVESFNYLMAKLQIDIKNQ